jgi:hypothetical protein
MEYNTKREDLVIPEYGRHIQKMVDLAVALENDEERNKAAQQIIKVMGQLNPSLRDVDEFNHKLWDQLHIISDFKLDVESPFPKPSKEILETRPERIPYSKEPVRYKHYGKNILAFIDEASKMEEGPEREAFVILIANMMKKAYLTWNKESGQDEDIFNDLKNISEGKLSVTPGTELIKSSEVLSSRPRKKQKPKKKKTR